MNTSVIVAIPRQDDYVWRISSEKIPHVTLCYLGEIASSTDMQAAIDYVEHVASFSMKPFGMEVDRRGVLGPKNADVLFFEDGHGVAKLNAYRDYFLKNTIINNAYLSTSQFPEFKPHLTLGYPEAPAHPDPRDYPGINWINFDRIALWTGDFEGPTFNLKSDDMLMSNSLEDVLAHFGVRGMRWGVRKNKSTGPVSPDASNAATIKEKMKTGGIHSLSNKEIQDAVTRMNLEQQLKSLRKNTSTLNKGHMAVKTILGVGATVSSIVAFVNSPAGKLVRQALTR
jgi:2'-5' RNA ligase